MGGIRNLSGDLSGKKGRGGLRVAHISKKDTANKRAGRGAGSGKIPGTESESNVISHGPPYEEFDSVWEALGFPPQESANLEARANLMIQLRSILKEQGWTQAEAAKHCGVSQPRINDLLRGRIEKFSIDALVNMATPLGLRVNFKLLAA